MKNHSSGINFGYLDTEGWGLLLNIREAPASNKLRIFDNFLNECYDVDYSPLLNMFSSYNCSDNLVMSFKWMQHYLLYLYTKAFCLKNLPSDDAISIVLRMWYQYNIVVINLFVQTLLSEYHHVTAYTIQTQSVCF